MAAIYWHHKQIILQGTSTFSLDIYPPFVYINSKCHDNNYGIGFRYITNPILWWSWKEEEKKRG
jgi:hypothetical protein